MWWVASAATAPRRRPMSVRAVLLRGAHQPRATEAAGLDEDDEIVLDEEPAASSASAESEEIVLEEEPTQDKPSTFRLPPPAFKPSTIVRTRSETSAAVDTAHQRRALAHLKTCSRRGLPCVCSLSIGVRRVGVGVSGACAFGEGGITRMRAGREKQRF